MAIISHFTNKETVALGCYAVGHWSEFSSNFIIITLVCSSVRSELKAWALSHCSLRVDLRGFQDSRKSLSDLLFPTLPRWL